MATTLLRGNNKDVFCFTRKLPCDRQKCGFMTCSSVTFDPKQLQSRRAARDVTVITMTLDTLIHSEEKFQSDVILRGITYSNALNILNRAIKF